MGYNFNTKLILHKSLTFESSNGFFNTERVFQQICVLWGLIPVPNVMECVDI